MKCGYNWEQLNRAKWWQWSAWETRHCLRDGFGLLQSHIQCIRVCCSCFWLPLPFMTCGGRSGNIGTPIRIQQHTIGSKGNLLDTDFCQIHYQCTWGALYYQHCSCFSCLLKARPFPLSFPFALWIQTYWQRQEKSFIWQDCLPSAVMGEERSEIIFIGHWRRAMGS